MLKHSLNSRTFRHVCLFYHGATALVGQDLFIIEASRSHSDTPHSVELLWKSDHPDAGNSTWQHKCHKRQTSITPVEFESTVPKSERPQTRISDREATGIGHVCLRDVHFVVLLYTKQVTFSGKTEIWAWSFSSERHRY